MTIRPILLNACARAATAEEARFRIDAPLVPARPTRIIAIDLAARALVENVARRGGFAQARFLWCDPAAALPASDDPSAKDPVTALDALVLTPVEGGTSSLGAELADAGVAVMVATDASGASIAARIGEACWMRGIMTAGLITGDDSAVSEALTALRPHARVLMVPADETDLAELLSAIRA